MPATSAPLALLHRVSTASPPPDAAARRPSSTTSSAWATGRTAGGWWTCACSEPSSSSRGALVCLYNDCRGGRHNAAAWAGGRALWLLAQGQLVQEDGHGPPVPGCKLHRWDPPGIVCRLPDSYAVWMGHILTPAEVQVRGRALQGGRALAAAAGVRLQQQSVVGR